MMAKLVPKDIRRHVLRKTHMPCQQPTSDAICRRSLRKQAGLALEYPGPSQSIRVGELVKITDVLEGTSFAHDAHS